MAAAMKITDVVLAYLRGTERKDPRSKKVLDEVEKDPECQPGYPNRDGKIRTLVLTNLPEMACLLSKKTLEEWQAAIPTTA